MKYAKPLLAALLLGPMANLSAQDRIVDTVFKGCATEIDTYCSQVSPGEGRLLACFFAHEDKLSGQCQYALYQAASVLDQAASALQYVATECESDIQKHCAEVEMGEGRILECLSSHSDAVSASCNTAIADVFE